MPKNRIPAKPLFLLSAVMVTLTPVQADDPQYEKPTVLSAAEVLPKADLSGPYHKVANRVTSDGYFNNYTLESRFGKETVEGQQLLEIGLRLSERNARRFAGYPRMTHHFR